MSSVLESPNHPCKNTSSGKMKGYIVEVRATHGMMKPFYIGRQLIDQDWCRIDPSYLSSDSGIPNGDDYFGEHLRLADLLDYPIAQAVRWAAIAMARARHVELETRLVRFELKFSWESTPEEAVDTIKPEEIPHA